MWRVLPREKGTGIREIYMWFELALEKGIDAKIGMYFCDVIIMIFDPASIS